MKLYNCPQGSEEWHKLRACVPTASEFDALISPTFQKRVGQMPHTYLCKKVAEKWQGGPLPSYAPFGAMEQGKILEEEAIPWYELEYNVTIQRPGFCTTDDGLIGCSPDGLIGDDGGIEIKCPFAETHVKYLLGGLVPNEYMAQVHGSLYVTGRKWWKFVSYRRGFPALVLTIERDEDVMQAFDDVLGEFLEKFDEAMQTMKELDNEKL